MDKNKKKKIKKIIKIVAIVLIAVFLIYTIFFKKDTNTRKTPTYTIEKITKRQIANSISGVGIIEAASSSTVTANGLGSKIKEVYVREGDYVTEGTLICEFETSSIEEQISELEKTIRNIKQDSRNAQKAIDDARNAQSKEISELETKTNEAKAKYDKAKEELDKKKEEDKKNSENTNTYTNTNLNVNDIDLNEIGNMTVNEVRNEISSNINYDYSQEEAELNRLWVEYQSAQSRLDTYKTTNNLSGAVSVDNNSLLSGYESQLRTLKNQLANTKVKAPASGTITSLSVHKGDTYLGSEIARIEGVDSFQVSAQIDEYNIPDVKVGMKVKIKTDATKEQELEGYITYVAPAAVTSGSADSIMSSLASISPTMSSVSAATNKAKYKVTISIATPNERLRIGMNAKLSIITEQKDDALTVPYDAIQERDDGSKYISVVKNIVKEEGKEDKVETEEVDVTVGIEGTYYSEIVSEKIKEGMEVYISSGSKGESIEALIDMMGSEAGI